MMSLRLPNPAHTKCRLLHLCGEIVADSAGRDVLHWLSQQKGKALEGRFGTKDCVWYLHVALRKSGKHVHVDAAAREIFGDSPPKISNKAKEIRALFKRLEGQEIDVEMSGVYAASGTDLPAVIRSTMVETRVGDVSLKTTGGRLAVEGAPIYELSWWIPRGGSDLRIELKARNKMRISNSYLEDCCGVLDSAFAVLFARK